MVVQQNPQEALIQNLKDAGCSSDTIAVFMHSHEQNITSGQIKILTEQRSLLLGYVRDNQKKLDCLDYLLYKIKKEGAI